MPKKSFRNHPQTHLKPPKTADSTTPGKKLTHWFTLQQNSNEWMVSLVLAWLNQSWLPKVSQFQRSYDYVFNLASI